MTKTSFNLGDEYEDKIFNILQKMGALPPGTKRAGAGTGTDMPFLRKGKTFVLEVKKDLQADYGQKMLRWSKERRWFWSMDDEVTKLYTKLGALEYLNKKGVVPIKFTKGNKDITLSDKRRDQKKFEDGIDIPISALYKYYESKNCFYIQIGKGFGFYHLAKDIAGLGTPQFNAVLKLRFRAKTIRSMPIWNYGFYAVLKIRLKTKSSEFNLETPSGQKLLSIEP